MRRVPRSTSRSFRDRDLFHSYWDYILLEAQSRMSPNRMKTLRFKVCPVIPNLFDLMFAPYTESIERKISKRNLSSGDLLQVARNNNMNDFRGEKFVGQGSFAQVDQLKVHELPNKKSWMVHMEFSTFYRGRCGKAGCPCTDYEAQFENEYVCFCTHKPEDHAKELN